MCSKLFLITITLVSLLCFGCSTLPVHYGYYGNPGIPIAERVSITIGKRVVVDSIDGRFLYDPIFSPGSNAERKVTVDSGIHVLKLRFFDAPGGVMSAKAIEAKYDFLAGKTYKLEATVQNKQIVFTLNEAIWVKVQ